MADTKISADPNATALAGTEKLAGVQSSANVNITPAQIKTFTSASPTLVTPALGVATATSVAIGGATIGTNALAVTGTSLLNGAATVAAATVMPAGGTADTGVMLSTTAHFGVFFGSGAPTLSAAKGSLYLRSDGTTTSDRMYVNTDAGTTWTAVTTVA